MEPENPPREKPSAPHRERFPRWVYRSGDEPDVRFTLANERTFLAWVRTALALIAGGVALEVLGLDLHPAWRLAAALVLILAGTAAPAVAWAQWMRNERSLREDRALPVSLLGPSLAGIVVLVGLLVTTGILQR